jgi:hypothetical protein
LEGSKRPWGREGKCHRPGATPGAPPPPGGHHAVGTWEAGLQLGPGTPCPSPARGTGGAGRTKMDWIARARLAAPSPHGARGDGRAKMDWIARWPRPPTALRLRDLLPFPPLFLPGQGSDASGTMNGKSGFRFAMSFDRPSPAHTPRARRGPPTDRRTARCGSSRRCRLPGRAAARRAA